MAPGAGVPVPADDRAATMGIQVELIRLIVQTSEDIFGRIRYIMSSLDSYNFVGKDPDHMFCMVIARPHDRNMVEKILGMLSLFLCFPGLFTVVHNPLCHDGDAKEGKACDKGVGENSQKNRRLEHHSVSRCYQ